MADLTLAKRDLVPLSRERERAGVRETVMTCRFVIRGGLS